MARVNANRLCPQVNAYAEAPILPSDGHRQMPVAASSLGMLTWPGGAATPTCPAASQLRRPTRCLLLLPRWQLCPLACSSWHVVLPSLRLVLQPSLRPGPAPLPPSRPFSGCPHLPPGPRLSSLPSVPRSLPSRTSAR